MRFTLVVCATVDGFIAREPGHAPHEWASPEEQALFLSEVAAADWGIMGRGTHEAADRPDRRRIVLSRQGGRGVWRRPTQLWVDPANLSPQALASRVARVHTLYEGLILGGTTVHDWFHAHGAIDQIKMTVEPVTFGAGLPLFSGQEGPEDPAEVVISRGYDLTDTQSLNAGGTELLTFARAGSADTWTGAGSTTQR